MFPINVLIKIRIYSIHIYAFKIEFQLVCINFINQQIILTATIDSRLQWPGHTKRMDENALARRAMECNPKGTRSRQRPKVRWMGCVRT